MRQPNYTIDITLRGSWDGCLRQTIRRPSAPRSDAPAVEHVMSARGPVPSTYCSRHENPCQSYLTSTRREHCATTDAVEWVVPSARLDGSWSSEHSRLARRRGGHDAGMLTSRASDGC